MEQEWPSSVPGSPPPPAQGERIGEVDRSHQSTGTQHRKNKENDSLHTPTRKAFGDHFIEKQAIAGPPVQACPPPKKFDRTPANRTNRGSADKSGRTRPNTPRYNTGSVGQTRPRPAQLLELIHESPLFRCARNRLCLVALGL